MAAAMQRQDEMHANEMDEDGGGDLLPPQVAIKLDDTILRKDAMRSSSLESVMEDGVSRLTVTSTDEIILKRPHASGTKVLGPTASGDSLDMASKVDAVPVICRTCGRVKCPVRDLVPQTKTSVDGSHVDGLAAPPICPICMQAANRRERNMVRLRREDNMRHRNQDTSVRVINLPGVTCKRDLYNLVSLFGLVAHVDDPQLDEDTVSHSKFGIVKFVQRQGAEVAVSWLNGYLYGGRTLRAECMTSGPEEVSDPSPICAVCMRAVDASVCVKNLPEDTCEHDLYNLLSMFGIVNKLFLALEKTEWDWARKEIWYC